MKADLVMWTYNGEDTIGPVLNRINHVFPKDMVNRRFIVDDHSKDKTREIAKGLGWDVLYNEGKGISSGANTALKNVEAPYFVSFEQDLLVSQEWISKIPRLVEGKVAVASGMRFANKPCGIRALQKYVARKYKGESTLSPYLKSRLWSAFTLGKSIDNTVYKTDVVNEIGGFPDTRTNVGVDTALAYEILNAGYEWKVDYSVQSVHLRRNLKHELDHQYWYGSQLPYVWEYVRQLGIQPHMGRWSVIWRLLNSPFTGVYVALKTREPSVVYTHPLMRFYFTKGLLKAGGKL
jgi:glycosyltransferase involved in cell wall biosynthesis